MFSADAIPILIVSSAMLHYFGVLVHVLCCYGLLIGLEAYVMIFFRYTCSNLESKRQKNPYLIGRPNFVQQYCPSKHHKERTVIIKIIFALY